MRRCCVLVVALLGLAGCTETDACERKCREDLDRCLADTGPSGVCEAFYGACLDRCMGGPEPESSPHSPRHP